MSIPITVLKPLYLQTWFLVLSGLSILGLIYAIFNVRTAQLKRQRILLEKMVQERTETIEKQKEELQNLDKVKTRFFANVSHELRTPLTLMLGPLSTMLKSNQLNNRNFTLAKLAQKNTKGLLSLVSEILDLTKMESGKLALKEETIAIFPITKRIISAYESHAQKQNINFEFHFKADNYLQVKLDKNKYEKILNNLISNALKFTSPNGKIVIFLEDLANRIKLTISDTGRGIHPDDLPHVFNRFYQSNQTNAPTEGGTGIGLSLAKEFVEMMKGAIWVESTLGEGASFYFEFPKKQIMSAIKEEHFSLDAAQDGSTQVLNNQNIVSQINKNDKTKPTLLIVEDNYSLRNYIELILIDRYNIVTTNNGQAAWKYLDESTLPLPPKSGLPPASEYEASSSSPFSEAKGGKGTTIPDLIISDIMMPFLDGYQLLKKLKVDDRFRGIPVIMLTARAEMQDKLKALRIGVDDYMLKPFEEEELFARIENLLRNSRERQLIISREEIVLELTSIPETQNSKLTSEDLEWLEKLKSVVIEEISNFDFNVNILSTKMVISKRQLERKIKLLTGLTPSKYILEIRLNQARQMLENETHSSVKAIIISIGLKDRGNFSKLFKARFGKLPSEYF